MRLNQIINKHKKKKEGKIFKDLDQGKYIWTTPALILVFLQNVIEAQTIGSKIFAEEVAASDNASPAHDTEKASPMANHEVDFKLRLPSWLEFKVLIYEIYDHRIYHAPEINGAINTSYLGLDEHLIIFFLSKYRTREVAEKRLIEFLASLKYYSEIWQRAK